MSAEQGQRWGRAARCEGVVVVRRRAGWTAGSFRYCLSDGDGYLKMSEEDE